MQLIRSSSLFDAGWYRSTYSDVAREGLDPLVHYLNYGWREGRDPGPDFDSSAYLKANPDVSALGINPLLHYVEFGRSEGRETFGRREILQQAHAAATDLEKPHSFASFPVEPLRSVPWIRSYRLDGANQKAIAVADQVIGFAGRASQKKEIQEAFTLLRKLSGLPEQRSAPMGIPETSGGLADAWFLNSAQLRTRWYADEFPFVVRSYQHDPLYGGALSILGERLVSSAIDPVDCQLRNPFFPVIFAFSQPDGELRGTEILAFPSLCRDGVHYAELLAMAADKGVSPDPLALGHELASGLIRLIDGWSNAAVRDISVDIGAADGLGPMFQGDFKLWLEKVIRVEVGPTLTEGLPKPESFLADTVSVRPARSRGRDGATLLIGHDMVPTIQALTADTQKQAPTRLLVAGSGRAGTVHSIELPIDLLPVLDALPGALPSKWPRLRSNAGIQSDLGASALRLPARAGPSEAELIVPVPNLAGNWMSEVRKPITWLIDPTNWGAKHLAQAIEALALQDGGAADQLVLAGAGERRDCAIAKARFADRFQALMNIRTAAAALRTPLVAFVGPAIVLHDNRTAILLSTILENRRVASASCPVITVEGLGKTWRAATAGDVVMASQLWGVSYPVAAPESNFWVARSPSLFKWLDQQALLDRDELHICTSLVTVSRVGKSDAKSSRIPVPTAPEDRVTQSKALVA